ncbi:hypothetical protein FOTG_02974 [Fusarium oxysporum f. sp. vasinfectum 25433]|uniref:Uncharacterized protein n=1 Tax=Fusarium oxysporum f. sp. vasinfectum 25433 TaxID=1089449 RepID=X0MH75_FUSOX|nr:hypothetical protein FOTG_02974 [Fusarium oxysporum f. sp. vasinfectum 25433]
MIPPKGQQKKKKKKKKKKKNISSKRPIATTSIASSEHSLGMELTAGQWSAWKLWNAPGTLSRPQPGLSCRANESQSADPSYRNVD